MLTVAQIVNEARDFHPTLSKQNAPLMVALRALSRFQRRFVTEIAHNVPAWGATEIAVAFPLASFDAGVDLGVLIPGGWVDLLDGYFTYLQSPSRRVKGEFVPWEQKDMLAVVPAYTLRSNVLYFLGGEPSYASIANFYLTYTPLPVALTTEQSVTVLPDDSLEAFAALLAAEWLKRMVGNPAFDVDAETAGVYQQDADKLYAAFITRIRRTGQRQSYRVRDVMSRSNPL